jgi:hypothetical protein
MFEGSPKRNGQAVTCTRAGEAAFLLAEEASICEASASAWRSKRASGRATIVLPSANIWRKTRQALGLGARILSGAAWGLLVFPRQAQPAFERGAYGPTVEASRRDGRFIEGWNDTDDLRSDPPGDRDTLRRFIPPQFPPWGAQERVTYRAYQHIFSFCCKA